MKAHVLSLLVFAACGDDAVKPSIALVHGAWETSTAWNPVAIRLTADGYHIPRDGMSLFAPFATDPGGLAAAIEQVIER